MESITSIALANVQAPLGMKMLKEAMDIQQDAMLQLLQSVKENTQHLQSQGIGRYVNALA